MNSLLNKTAKITNISCHWKVINLDSNTTVSIGSDSLVFKKGFWDFESMKKFFKTKNVTLEENAYDNTCSIGHASEDIGLGDLSPLLGFPNNKTVSGTETSSKSVDILKGLSTIEIRSSCVYYDNSLDQGVRSNLLLRFPIDTKQVFNGTITTYQPWSTTRTISNTFLQYIDFDVTDNSLLDNPYTLYVEIIFE